MSKREDFHVYSSTTHHRHRNHTAVSDAKYCVSVDMANMMIHGTSELEVGKKSNLPYPLVRDAQDYKKDASNGYEFKKSQQLEHSEMRCKTEVTNTLRTNFSN